MGSMIKLRHQQLSLWHSGLAEEIEDLWERGCVWSTVCWKMSSCWTRYMSVFEVKKEIRTWNLPVSICPGD